MARFMRYQLNRFLILSLLIMAALVSSGHVASAVDTFAHRGVAADAKRYETFLKDNWKTTGKTEAQLKSEAEALFATDVRAASRLLAAAVVEDGAQAETWVRLAEALLQLPKNPKNPSERYDIPVHASGAAYRGYELATTDKQRADALYVLGQALERRSYWRPAITAAKLAVELGQLEPARVLYDRLRAAHGFRMSDYKIENELSAPRVCLEFSEPLSRTTADFASFVSVDGKDPQSVVAEQQRLCVEGLTHGQRYQIQVRAGLPSYFGEVLNKAADLAIYVPDRSPFVRFSGKSYVLPSRGQQGIPVVSTNTDKISVTVYRIGDRSLVQTLQSGDFQRQLWQYEAEQLNTTSAVTVFKGDMAIRSRLNEDVTTAIPVTDATGKLEPGTYVMLAEPSKKTKDSSGQLATQWFIVSDLGLTAFSGSDGVHVFVRSLADATPIAESKVKLVARNNEELATATTDSNGYARFSAALAGGEGGSKPAVIVAEKGEGEYAFLDMTASAFDLSDRGVKGRDPAGPVDAYIYTERGVYRGGEDINVSALVRDNKGHAAELPTTLIIKRPDGVEHSRMLLNNQGLGGRTAVIPLAKTAMTGTWRLWLHTDPKQPAIAERSVLVEDFVPERLDMTIASTESKLTPVAPHTISASGRYLYGPPASGLSLEGEVIVRAANTDVEGFAGYAFGDADAVINPVREAIDGHLIMDKDGKADIALVLPAIPKTAKPLAADIIVRLNEPSGRSIQRKLTLPVDAGQPRIGIKPKFSGNRVGEGETAAFDVVMLDANSKQTGGTELIWTLTRLDTNWQWYRRDGSWSYDAVTIKRKVADGRVNSSADIAATVSQTVGYGRYRLDIASSDAGGPSSSLLFSAGWYTSGDAIESPEQIETALDKTRYTAGDTAKLRIASKHGGKALVAVLGTTLHVIKTVDVAAGGADVEIPVDKNWGAGAYVTTLLYRAMDETQKRMPTRGIGIAWLGLEQSARTVSVDLTPPEKIKSGETLSVPLKVNGLKSGEAAFVTLTAVDVGILNLTGFETPQPDAWFNAQHKLGFEVRDFYGRLIDGMRADRGTLKSGGDGTGPVMQGNPTVETVVSLFSGLVRLDETGAATVSFEVPDFNGTLRLMAVAWSADKTGHGSTDIIVRDAVAMTISAPRFMTLGDEIKLGFDVHNIEAPKSDFALVLSQVQGTAASERSTILNSETLALETGARKLQRIAFKPKDIGPVTLRATITGPGDLAIKRDMTFEVMPPAGDIKRTTITSLAGNGGTVTLSRDLVADMIASRTQVNISAGPTARFDVPTLLAQLDRYPYGCAEQTVSRALPLVYANAVAARVGIGADKELKARVQAAVNRVFELQDASGAFGIWGPSDADLWLTAYVTDFLTRAREGGAEVAANGFNRALDRLQNFLNYAEDFDTGGEDRAYALYVLARNGRAPVGELRYYADTRIDRFSSPLAKAQIGAALSMVGDRDRAERSFQNAIAMIEKTATETEEYRSDYGSNLRDGAALLTLAKETGVATSASAKLTDVIVKAYETRSYTSTQEQAWMLLAANASADAAKALSFSVAGAPSTGPLFRSLKALDLGNGDVVIRNDSDAAVDTVISVIGAALTPEPAVDNGFKITRQAYTLDGKPANLASLEGGDTIVKQNERFVMVVNVVAEKHGGRVMLVDRLPAGFEIENPRLVPSGTITGLQWLTSTTTPEHTEFRDDRFVAAFNVPAPQPASDTAAATGKPAMSATLAYVVRAVTPGKYVHPAATVEDMYRPERHGRTASGQLTVAE